MNEQVKRYGPTCDCMSEMAWGDYVRASEYDALQSRLDAAEREKSALRHALDVKEEFYQDALHSHIVLNAKVAKRDAVLRETTDSLRCSKVFPALLESIDALLSSAGRYIDEDEETGDDESHAAAAEEGEV